MGALRIAVITHAVARGDGQGRVNYEIVKGALRDGHRVVVVASRVAPDLAANPQLTVVPIRVGGWPTELVRNQVFAWRASAWLRRHAASCDLVVANGGIVWGRTDVNVVHFVHSAWRRSPVHVARTHRGPYAWYQWLYSALNSRWEQRAFRQTRVIVAVSERVRNELVGLGLSPAAVRVIHNGVDVEEFAPGSGDRRRWGLPAAPLGLFVGDLRTRRKNLDTTLAAVARLPDLHLAVVGDPSGSPFPQMAESLGIAERVHFLGVRRDVPDLMRTADVFLFPSRYEACSLVLLESLASGLPIVTASTAGGAELVDDGCGIVLDDPDDVTALVDAITTVLSSHAEVREMGRRARAVAEQHTWATMAGRYLEIFEQLAPRRGLATETPRRSGRDASVPAP